MEYEIKKLIVTGGAGFIGSHFVRLCIEKGFNVTVIDKLSYSGSLEALNDVRNNKNFEFFQRSILDDKFLLEIFREKQYDALINFAAETHVDRSIENSSDFVLTNVLGVQKLLDLSLDLHKKNQRFKFIQISTDEVFGSIKNGSFSENSKYKPNSPYAASKASGDHLVLSYYKTYGLPIIITNCSNNYGSNQFPEKFVPLLIIKALQNLYLPIYGDGNQMRDWINVKDHCEAILLILDQGNIGEQYLIGAENCIRNIDMAEKICTLLDDLLPLKNKSYKNLIKFVSDRPGHDLRYSINSNKIKNELGWRPKIEFDEGLKETIKWYLNNKKIWEKILKEKYSGQRLGLNKLI